MAEQASESTGRDAVVPAVWAAFYDETLIPAAVWSGNTLRLTGHTGEDGDGVYPADPAEQVRGTFRNIAITLAEAGASWADVVEINAYHIGLREQSDAIFAVAADYLHAPYPAWTAVGVTELFPPDAVVEISCVAVVSVRENGVPTRPV
jgi:enamine deaminase RidA (YjgF/YER057c/UK114 family)